MVEGQVVLGNKAWRTNCLPRANLRHKKSLVGNRRGAYVWGFAGFR